ncbi:MAG TPA: DUF6152 family protein [Afifellaceae bacterium]|nr:DUF6152 family protein [Afifellaceae bacterium]
MNRFSLFRRAILTAFAVSPLVAGHAVAHHGWAWTDDEPFELTGTIEEIYLGNPHATLSIRAEDGVWDVDLAPPRRTAQSGFVEGVAEPGDDVTAYGYRSRDENERRMKAARIVIDGDTYDVYPERAQAF